MEKATPTNPGSTPDALLMRYVAGEMDPAEAAAFRMELEADQNLLIEAESLRLTLTRMKNLPRHDAPEAVLQAVLAQAAQRPAPVFRWYYAAAAVLLLAASLFSARQILLRSASHERPVPVAGHNQAPGSLNGNLKAPDTSWKDRNRVVTLDDMSGKPDSSRALHPRLKPVAEPAAPAAAASSSVTLTRSN